MLTGWILVLMSSSTTLWLRPAMSQSATLPVAASSSPLLLRTSARGGRTTRGRARSRPGDPAPAVAGPRRKPVSARAEIRTPRAFREPSTRGGLSYNAAGVAVWASDHGTSPSSRETTRPLSPGFHGVVFAKTATYRRMEGTRCTCPWRYHCCL